MGDNYHVISNVLKLDTRVENLYNGILGNIVSFIILVEIAFEYL